MTSGTSAIALQKGVSLIFVDDALIFDKVGVERTVHPCDKLNAPVIVADRPWEGQRVYTYGTIHYYATQGLFQMWYNSHSGTEHKHRAPQLRGRAVDLVLYATSTDGVHWEKPSLGLYEFDGSRQNNIVFDVHSPSVIVDDAAEDVGKRYKMVAHGKGMGGYWGAFSGDGLHWTDVAAAPIIPGGDTITGTRDPRTGEYLAFHKQHELIRGHTRRTIWLSTSPDFETWTEPQPVLAPDERDDEWVRASHERTEFYVMSAFPYAGQFLGLVSVFRLNRIHETVSPGQSAHDGPIDIQLTYSPDGRTWHRLAERVPVIPLGAPGSFDGGCILGVSNPPVIYRDEMWVYYTAITTGHGGAMPEKRISIGRASWRLDGFVSLDADGTGGIVETVLLQMGGGALELNADASCGTLAVELVAADGTIIPGYAREECAVLRASGVSQPIAWRARTHLPDMPCRLRFYLRNAQLYSFAVR